MTIFQNTATPLKVYWSVEPAEGSTLYDLVLYSFSDGGRCEQQRIQVSALKCNYSLHFSVVHDCGGDRDLVLVADVGNMYIVELEQSGQVYASAPVFIEKND